MAFLWPWVDEQLGERSGKSPALISSARPLQTSPPTLLHETTFIRAIRLRNQEGLNGMWLLRLKVKILAILRWMVDIILLLSPVNIFMVNFITVCD